MSHQPTPTEPDRRTTLGDLIDLMRSGLPTPRSIEFITTEILWIQFEGGVTELDAWDAALELSNEHNGRTDQPHPLTGDHEYWTTSAWGTWRGWRVTLKTSEPITPQHVERWISSGGAARHAEHLARKAAEQVRAEAGELA